MKEHILDFYQPASQFWAPDLKQQKYKNFWVNQLYVVFKKHKFLCAPIFFEKLELFLLFILFEKKCSACFKEIFSVG